MLPEARLACGSARVHAMHDPTEGGVATACWELAQAADAGVRVHRGVGDDWSIVGDKLVRKAQAYQRAVDRGLRSPLN